MNIEMKLVAPPDKNRTKRDGGPITFADPPVGDCTTVCPACKRALDENVSIDYVQLFATSTCGYCGAVSSRSR